MTTFLGKDSIVSITYERCTLPTTRTRRKKNPALRELSMMVRIKLRFCIWGTRHVDGVGDGSNGGRMKNVALNILNCRRQ